MARTRRSAAGETDAAGDEPGPDPAGLSFEGALEQLERTVDRLEEGEMPLEDALELFESGVALSRQCSTTLEAAERRVELLVADRVGSEPVTERFDDAGWSADEDEDGDEADDE